MSPPELLKMKGTKDRHEQLFRGGARERPFTAPR